MTKPMDPKDQATATPDWVDRFRRSWFPLAAVAAALAAFVGAAFRVRPTPRAAPQPSKRPGPPARPDQAAGSAPPAVALERTYEKVAALGGSASGHTFKRSLAGVAIGAADRIYVLGDDEIRIFESSGAFVKAWKCAPDAACLAVGSDGRVSVGAPGRVEIHGADGNRAGGFAAGDKGAAAAVTSVKFFRKEILVADASVRSIRRYDLDGNQLGVIGTRNKTGGFMLPNGWLDFDVDAQGVIRATDTGRHRVTSWALDGSPLGAFGKFGMRDPMDFVGCCNPVNLALAPDGTIVTAEKMVARVKVYEPDGRLLALIGPEHFDPDCVHIHLAVDSRGRILAADPVRREVSVFNRTIKAGVRTPALGNGSAEEGRPL